MTPLPPDPPDSTRRAFERLRGQQRALAAERDRCSTKAAELRKYLEIAPAVGEALQKLSEDLFRTLADVLEKNLSLALQEVLGQAVSLKVKQNFKRGGAVLELNLVRQGQEEDIMRGTGGSVANILSVGLRLFALSQLDEKTHRRFLVLDEQDCWLAPDLVPKLVKLISDAGRTLGFQVMLISHHAASSFEQYADRVYRFIPKADGVAVERLDPSPSVADE